MTAALYPTRFNASNDNQNFDDRSDDKGPEPEGVVVGKVGRETYAFTGYANHRNFDGIPADGTAGDLGP